VIATALAGVVAISMGAVWLFADRNGPGTSDAADAGWG